MTSSRAVSPFRGALLGGYRWVTSIQRRRLREEFIRVRRVPVAILFYHRIAEDVVNSWTMNRSDFQRQLDWLSDHFDVVGLAEAQRRIASAENDRPTVAITFDDGYAENMDFALPELVRRGLSATYFVSTHFVQSGKSFPHDAAMGYHFPPNTIDHLRQIADWGIELGAHTRTHCNLGSMLQRDEVIGEIVGSADDIRQWCHTEVKYFSFPTGLPANTSQLAIDVLKEFHFHGCCTAYGAWNWPGDEAFHMRRIHADPGLQSLKNWLTLDPRKLIDRHPLPFDTTKSAPVSLVGC